MHKAILFLCVIVSAACAAFAAPSTNPAATTRATEPVRVNDADFQLVTSEKWTPTAGAAVDIPLSLLITNQGKTPLEINLHDTVEYHLTDSTGKEMTMSGGRDESYVPQPLLAAKGETATIDAKASLAIEDNKKTLRLTASDHSGGNWWFAALQPGQYTLSISYKNTANMAKFVDSRPAAKHPVIPPDATFWIGEAQTKEMKIVIEP